MADIQQLKRRGMSALPKHKDDRGTWPSTRETKAFERKQSNYIQMPTDVLGSVFISPIGSHDFLTSPLRVLRVEREMLYGGR